MLFSGLKELARLQKWTIKSLRIRSHQSTWGMYQCAWCPCMHTLAFPHLHVSIHTCTHTRLCSSMKQRRQDHWMPPAHSVRGATSNQSPSQTLFIMVISAGNCFVSRQQGLDIAPGPPDMGSKHANSKGRGLHYLLTPTKPLGSICKSAHCHPKL